MLTGRQDVNHARVAGVCVGEGQRGAGRVAEGASENRATDKGGQVRERAGALRGSHRLGDEHVFLVCA